MATLLVIYLSLLFPGITWKVGAVEFVLRFLANLVISQYTWDPKNTFPDAVGRALGLTIVHYISLAVKAQEKALPILTPYVFWAIYHLYLFLEEFLFKGNWPKY